MRSFSKILLLMAAIVGFVGIGVLLGWLGIRSPAGTSPLTASKPSGSVQSRATDITLSRHSPESSGVSTALASTTSPTNFIADWEGKIEEIVGSGRPDDEKARQLLQVFPRLPPDGQIDVVQHLENLVSDDDYAPMGKLFRDASLPEPVLDELLADVLNRSNALKLPALLDVARTERHPKAAEAKEIMGLFLEADYGNDWPRWQTKMGQWLKDNPD